MIYPVSSLLFYLFAIIDRGRGGRDRIVVGYTTTYAISAYHYWCCEFESRSGRGVQHYVIKFVSDLQQVGGFLRVLRFPPPIKLTATIWLKYCWNATLNIIKQTNKHTRYSCDILDIPVIFLWHTRYSCDILDIPVTYSIFLWYSCDIWLYKLTFVSVEFDASADLKKECGCLISCDFTTFDQSISTATFPAEVYSTTLYSMGFSNFKYVFIVISICYLLHEHTRCM
jgi:hypothetical protein